MRIYQKFLCYVREQVGSIATMFALMAPVLVGGMGVGLDMAQAYLTQERLAHTLDAAALAAAGSSADEAEIRQKVLDFFAANFRDWALVDTLDPVVEINGDEITVTGFASYHTWFMHMLGVSELAIEAETTVQRKVQGIEVALVMDNTGSMGRNNNIGTLRTAATNFVNIMFAATEDPSYIRIGLVPYSTSVNVGPYGLGEDQEGAFYDTPFVNNPLDVDYSPGSYSDWGGCVLALDNPDDTIDHEGPWDMYRWCRRTNDDYPICNRRWVDGEYVPRNSANRICPRTPIVPLSNDQDLLLDTIDTMRASGHTYGNLGMTWGYRVLSPEYPFKEGAAWDSLYWRKAVIMMTDGRNTMNRTYSAYGRTSDHNVDAGDLNERFAETCETMKQNNITIYTITFSDGAGDLNTKQIYEDCASSASQYHHAPTQEDLINVFETIGRELSNLHIKS